MVLAPFTRRTPSGLFPGLRRGPSLGSVDVPPAVSLIRLLVLVMVVVTTPLSTPHFGAGRTGIATIVTLVVSVAAWIVWQFSVRRPYLWLGALAVMGLAGGALAGLSSVSTAVAIGCVVAASAGARLSAEVSVAIVAETIAAFLVAALITGTPAIAVIGSIAGFLGVWAFGLTRRAYLLRAVEAEEALEQTRRAHAAETQAAALAERARIAREIHDVLAHSLAAVSVNLRAAEGLLDAVPGKGAELTKAIECVERAGALTKEGMTEARRAILALRDDDGDGAAPGGAAPGGALGPAAAALPAGAGDGAGVGAGDGTGAGPVDGEAAGPRAERLTGRLRALAEEHGTAGDAPVEFTVTGTPRRLGTERALTVFRTAQEALTNARKHAPGQPVAIAVEYTPRAMTLRVSNPLPPAGTAGPLAHAGTGYGLTGLRERAALARGTLTAGAADGAWQVLLRLPG